MDDGGGWVIARVFPTLEYWRLQLGLFSIWEPQ